MRSKLKNYMVLLLTATMVMGLFPNKFVYGDFIGASIVADEAITEKNLDERSVIFILNGESFNSSDLEPENFVLNNAPSGATIESVSYIDDNNCTINLAYDGTDFDTTVTDFSITIKREALKEEIHGDAVRRAREMTQRRHILKGEGFIEEPVYIPPVKEDVRSNDLTIKAFLEVDFEVNASGVSSVERQSVEEGGKIELPEAPLRDGYTIKGWYNLESEGQEIEWDFDTDVVTHDMLLFAKWEVANSDGGDEDNSGEDNSNQDSSIVNINTVWSGSLENEIINQRGINPDNIKEINITAGELTDEDVMWLSNNVKNMEILNIAGEATFASDVLPDGAFSNHTNSSNLDKLSEVTIDTADEVSFGRDAFWICRSLKTATLGNTRVLGEKAFMSCDSLEKVSMAKLEILGQCAFLECTSLVDVELPNAKEDKGGIFARCTSLTKIYMPNMEILNDSFSGCTKLVDVYLPKVSSLGNHCFEGCTALENIELPKAVSFGEDAFCNCTSLADVKLPIAESFEDDAFSNCKSLEHISLPNALHFGEGAFSNCESLVDVQLPLAHSFGEYAFAGCIKLEEIILPEALEFESGAFSECTVLEKVGLPKVIIFGGEVFLECKNLKVINLPSTTNLGELAFIECDSLKEINIPKIESIPMIYLLNSETQVTIGLGNTPPNVSYLDEEQKKQAEEEGLSLYDPEKYGSSILIPKDALESYDPDKDGMWNGWKVTFIDDTVPEDKIAPVLQKVTVESSNRNKGTSKVGDKIVLDIVANEDIDEPVVMIAGKTAEIDDLLDNDAKTWKASYTMLQEDLEGKIAFTINYKDLSKNSGTQISDTTDNSKVIFDKTLPKIKTLVPMNGATDVKLNSDLTITFDENIVVNKGHLSIYKYSDDKLLDSYDVSSEVSKIATDKIVIKPKRSFEYNTQYYIKLDSESFTDESGNDVEGITDNEIWNFKTIKKSNSNSSNSSGSSGGGTQPVEQNKKNNDVTVVVNGKTQNAGLEKIQEKNGEKTVEVFVDGQALKTKIDQILSEKNAGYTKNIVEVPIITTDASSIKTLLTGDIVKNMEDSKFDLSVKTKNINYIIPAKEIEIQNVAKKLNVDEKSLKSIEVDIVIKNIDSSLVSKMKEQAVAKNYEIIFEPVDFSVIAKTETLTGEIKETVVSKFDSYVERIVEISSDIDPSKITTGIVYNPDGTFSHVPTEVFEKDGKWYAKLNSLTNSSYTVIWNPTTVQSVDNHWAKDVVNDMASRLVIDDKDNFMPNKNITRGEFAEYITKALGIYRSGIDIKDEFVDVKSTDESADVITIAVDYGIIKGYADGSFRPNQTITREEAMVMYARAMGIVKLEGDDNERINKYKDYSDVSEWAKGSVKSVISVKVFNGTSVDKLSPKAQLTCAEAATAIRNLLIESSLINK